MFKKIKINILYLRTGKLFIWGFIILGIDSFSASCTGAEDNLRVWLFASSRKPIRQADQEWDSFQTYGLRFELPTPARLLNMTVSLDGGKLARVCPPYQHHAIVHGTISFHFTPPWFDQKIFSVRPFTGISNTMVFPWDSKPVEDMDVFKSTESEFGVVAGIEPLLTFKRYLVALPIQLDHVMSHPHPFTTFAMSLSLGWSF
ncbi:MAG: hypothetical protein ACOC4C_03165 [Fibrobacterota bacterium]